MHSFVSEIIFFLFDFQSPEQSKTEQFFFFVSFFMKFSFMHITIFSGKLEIIFLSSNFFSSSSSKFFKLIYSKLVQSESICSIPEICDKSKPDISNEVKEEQCSNI